MIPSCPSTESEVERCVSSVHPDWLIASGTELGDTLLLVLRGLQKEGIIINSCTRSTPDRKHGTVPSTRFSTAGSIIYQSYRTEKLSISASVKCHKTLEYRLTACSEKAARNQNCFGMSFHSTAAA